MNQAIACIATFVAKEECAEQLKRALTDLIQPTRNEAGCLKYELYLGIENPLLFTMVEEFISQSAFEAHSNQPYLLSFKQIVGDLASSISMNLYAKSELMVELGC